MGPRRWARTSRLDGRDEGPPSRPTGGVSTGPKRGRDHDVRPCSAFMAGMALVSADWERFELKDQAFMSASVRIEIGQGGPGIAEVKTRLGSPQYRHDRSDGP